ncbi:Putative phosphotransferase HMPREF5505_0251 [Lactobacillus equicursoris 66c]|uniref:Putative pyruvate, phosphate dikinase regulatory protein n=2 Tax=Lactobacillus equicursoris TaxID=420645 RepID=K0NY81_9LACO|nr:pyruvate, water dikinase regulatory protein [Lactobacillus equicursoris]MDD6407803.1 kinase/pyrophosphorylase [Lactobacillus equicursoris]MST80378.1 kinase/pyrophosphorylase [Lactobacillus equicursoris]CCK84580.1 Putative phosphotransferase HMPREF5505_0251 [Lactobacillus equicursoris 66c]
MTETTTANTEKTTEKEKIEVNIIIISDSAGETAFNNAQAAAVQFPGAEINYRRYPFITDQKKLDKTLDEIEQYPNLVIVYSLVDEKLQLPIIKYAREHKAKYIDILSPIIEAISQTTHLKPEGLVGANHQLTTKYFNRISAMEFAVMYDDGKDPRGFLEADVVLLGVSRTSKTPLSLLLANKGLKVANLPLVPQTHIPKEIYEIDPKKIIGLTNDPKVLNRIRRQRMISYGMDPDTTYSNMDSINEELESAMALYKKLGCFVINVAERSIEETAALIMNHLGYEED